MGEPEQFILDTNVLSSFYAVNWLEGTKCWCPERSLLAPKRVWTEFSEYWDADHPEWLNIQEVDLDSPRVQLPGALALADWACIILAESVEEACVITNDKGMHTVAEQRDVAYSWGTRFLLDTFHRCGISEKELTNGIDSYSSDLGLGSGVVGELEKAEK